MSRIPFIDRGGGRRAFEDSTQRAQRRDHYNIRGQDQWREIIDPETGNLRRQYRDRTTGTWMDVAEDERP